VNTCNPTATTTVSCVPTCSVLGGKICNANEKCLGTTQPTSDGACCNAECKSPANVQFLATPYTFSVGSPFMIQAKVTKLSDGTVYNGVQIIAELYKENGLIDSVTTNVGSDGLASFSFKAISETGAYTLKVKVTDGTDNEVSYTVNIQPSLSVQLSSPLPIQYNNKPITADLTTMDSNNNFIDCQTIKVTADINGKLVNPTIERQSTGVNKIKLTTTEYGKYNLKVELGVGQTVTNIKTLLITVNKAKVYAEYGGQREFVTDQLYTITFTVKNAQSELEDADVKVTLSKPDTTTEQITASKTSTGTYMFTRTFTAPGSYTIEILPSKLNADNTPLVIPISVLKQGGGGGGTDYSIITDTIIYIVGGVIVLFVLYKGFKKLKGKK